MSSSRMAFASSMMGTELSPIRRARCRSELIIQLRDVISVSAEADGSDVASPARCEENVTPICYMCSKHQFI